MMQNDAHIQNVGYQMVRGGVRYLVKVLVLVAVAAFILGSIFGKRWPVDSSDVDRNHRSGLRVYTDAATGTQYLGDRNGGLVLRVDREGRPFSDGPAVVQPR